MSMEIKIPSVGESVQEAVLAEWFKADGEQVQIDEPLLVIETDKVTLEVVAEAAGKLKILVQAGETVTIGAVVGLIEAGKGAVVEKPAEPEPEPAPKQVEAAPMQPPAAEAGPVEKVPQEAGVDMQLAPSVRRLIAEKGLDAGRITGTGPGGRISKGDVLLYLEQAPAGIPDTLAQPASLETTAGPSAEPATTIFPVRIRSMRIPFDRHIPPRQI